MQSVLQMQNEARRLGATIHSPARPQRFWARTRGSEYLPPVDVASLEHLVREHFPAAPRGSTPPGGAVVLFLRAVLAPVRAWTGIRFTATWVIDGPMLVCMACAFGLPALLRLPLRGAGKRPRFPKRKLE